MLKGSNAGFLIVDVASGLFHLCMESDGLVVEFTNPLPLLAVGAVGIFQFAVMVCVKKPPSSPSENNDETTSPIKKLLNIQDPVVRS